VVAPTAERPRILWPHVLPDGQRFLYSWSGLQQTGGVVLVDDNGERDLLSAARSQTQFVAPDLLLMVREATLVAQRVDLAAARLLGDSVPIGRVSYSSATGWGEFSASPGGMLAMRTHLDESALTIVTRDGRAEREIGAPGWYNTVRAAPDGSALLFSRWRPEPGTFAVWRMRLDREAETQLTASPVMETAEVWVPGMREMVLTSALDQVPNIVLRDLSSGQDRRLSRSRQFQLANDVSPDRILVLQQRTPQGHFDLMQLPLDAPERVTPLMTTRFSEVNLRFSPDGRHVSFMSDESGRMEVYVAPFPLTGIKTQVSSGGGSFGRWHPGGRELYFLSAQQQLMAVAVDQSGHPGTPKALFDTIGWADYDVLSGGTRFIANIAKSTATEQPLSILLNWPQLLQRSPR
jgi:Tol biopolymer transport system component